MSEAQKFVMEKEPTVSWPVTVNVPADGGKLNQFTFNARIRLVSEDEYEAVISAAAVDDKKDVTMKDILNLNVPAFERLIADWDLSDVDGAVPISRLQEVVTGGYGRYVSSGLWSAIYSSRSGAALGN